MLLTSSTVSSWHWIGMMQLFDRLAFEPDAWPNTSSTAMVVWISDSTGLINNATSSAYKESLCPAVRLDRGCNNPWSLAATKRLLSTSITIMKSIRDSGSPRRSPRWCLIVSPGSPFSSILVVEVVRRFETKLNQEFPKPKWVKTSIRKAQDTESKAFDMSSLRQRLGTLCRYRTLFHNRRGCSITKNEEMHEILVSKFSLGPEEISFCLICS